MNSSNTDTAASGVIQSGSGISVDMLVKLTDIHEHKLSAMADHKAEILITVNSIIISAIIGLILKELSMHRFLAFPSYLLLTVNILTMIRRERSWAASITGRWKVHAPRGPQFLINFRTDKTFTAYTDAGKVLITGNYRIDKDSFFVNDLNCNGAYWGKYHLDFITNDSISFKVVSDSCSGRAEAVNGIVIARLKQN